MRHLLFLVVNIGAVFGGQPIVDPDILLARARAFRQKCRNEILIWVALRGSSPKPRNPAGG